MKSTSTCVALTAETDTTIGGVSSTGMGCTRKSSNQWLFTGPAAELCSIRNPKNALVVWVASVAVPAFR